jgi:methylated-DNA-protein-cysteine methyltransferase-like protein
MSEFNDKVYEIVRQIPYGRVMTYGQIAALMGIPRAARAVGWALHAVAPEAQVPCQRVVNRYGGLASGYGWGGQLAHRLELAAEAVEISDDFIVDLSKYQWWPEENVLPELQLSPYKRDELDRNLPVNEERLSYSTRRSKPKMPR